MKDEIIDNIKADLLYCYEDGYSTKEEYERKLDYITNLEKENENRISESLSYDLAVARIKELEQENKVLLEKYSIIQILYNSSKLKNDKAIEYINEWLDGKNNDDIIIAMNSLGNILQGGDK